MLLMQKIEEISYKNSGSWRSIGEFLITHLATIHQYSMQEIADQTYTSKSTLVRFAKSLGYDGWKKMMEDLLRESHFITVHHAATDVNIPFHEDDSLPQIVAAVSTLMTETILETLDLIHYDELEKAVNLLMEKKNILILAQSPNVYEAELFRRKMLSIGRNVLISNYDTGLLASSMDNEQTVCIMISYSGNNPDRYPVNKLGLLREKGIPVIALTGLGDSVLRNQADCVLNIASRERLYSKIATFSTEESIATLLNALYSGVFVKNYQENLDYRIHQGRRWEKRFTNYFEMREDE